MQRQATIFTLILFAVWGCSSDLETIRTHDEAGNLLEQYQIDRKTGDKVGLYERYAQGNLIETATYHRDTLHGVRTLLYTDGKKEIEETYLKGVFEGDFRSYYENGQVKLEGLYVGGKMHGPWIKYYPSGEKMEVVEMQNNEENGPFIEYHENGKLKAEGHYLEGDNEDGELKLYDERGELEKRMLCDKGICQTIWKREVNLTE